MADLSDRDSSLTVKITGAGTTGAESNFIDATTAGGMHTNLRNASGTEIGTSSNPVRVDPTGTTAQPVSQSGTWSNRLQDGSGNAITSSSNGLAGNQLLHTQTPDTTTASTALGALNASVSIAMSGLSAVGFQITAGTLVGTITPESSIDGGTTWAQAAFYDSTNSTVSTSVVFSSSNTTKILSILPVGGSSHVRVRVSAYTSGTGNSLLRASQVISAAGAVTAAAYGTIANTFPTTGANTATQILASNINRKYAYISNGSGTQVNIQFGSGTGLSTTTGIAIPAKSFYELKGDNLFTGAIFAFAASNITLSVGEGTP